MVKIPNLNISQFEIAEMDKKRKIIKDLRHFSSILSSYHKNLSYCHINCQQFKGQKRLCDNTKYFKKITHFLVYIEDLPTNR